jgi:hypothetical protein
VISISSDFLLTTNKFDEPLGLDGRVAIRSFGKSKTKEDKSI